MHHDEQWESPTERQGLFNMSKHIYIAQYIDLKKKEFILFQEISKVICTPLQGTGL